MNKNHMLNRQQRRAMKAQSSSLPYDDQLEAAGDHCWNDLKRIYLECLSLSVSPNQILPIITSKERLSTVKDLESLNKDAAHLNSLVKEFDERLKALYAKHKDREGSSNNPEDLMLCLSIGEEYQEWLHRYQSTVTYLIYQVMSYFDKDFLSQSNEGQS